MTKTKTRKEILAEPLQNLSDLNDRFILEADVLRERTELKQKLQELLNKKPRSSISFTGQENFNQYFWDVDAWFQEFAKVLAVLGKEGKKE